LPFQLPRDTHRQTQRERERERERDGERQQEHEGFFAIAAETRSFLKEIHICCWVLFVRNKQTEELPN
jgi:hypothetical protein